MDRSDEYRALGALAGDALAATVGVVGDVHSAVSARVEAALPPPAKPIAKIVELSAAANYATVRAAHRWIPRGVAAVAAATAPPDAPPLTESRAGRVGVATLNGIWGPAVTDGVALTTPMTLSHRGTPLPPDPAAWPTTSSHLVIFAHGLAETAHSWGPIHHPDGTTTPSYPEQLEADVDAVAVSLEYSTGRAVPDNGAELADLLEALVTHWPGELASIALIGHSMGGLVSRSAAHQGHLAGHAWVDRLRLIVTLGTPHLGAPLAVAVDNAERALNVFPESAPIGRILGARSTGVTDLVHGRIVHGAHSTAAGPKEPTPEEAPDLVDDAPASPVFDPPPVAHVTHCTVAATLSRDPAHPVGRLLGDGMVLLPSASGRSRSRHIPFHVDAHLGATSHLALLNNAAVYPLVRGWVEEFALEG